MGASLNASAGRDYTLLNLKTLKKDLDKGLDLLIDVLTRPTFPEEEVQREVEKALAAIQSDEDRRRWWQKRHSKRPSSGEPLWASGSRDKGITA